MSALRGCDGPECTSALVVNRNGEDVDGESVAWLVIEVGGQRFDLCTRACAHQLLDDAAFIKAVDEQAAAVAEVARIIRDGDGDGPG